MVEQLTLNQLVLGSSPSRGTNFTWKSTTTTRTLVDLRHKDGVIFAFRRDLNRSSARGMLLRNIEVSFLQAFHLPDVVASGHGTDKLSVNLPPQKRVQCESPSRNLGA
jgi:hypothetical protein